MSLCILFDETLINDKSKTPAYAHLGGLIHFCRIYGYCDKSNDIFAHIYDVSIEKIQNWHYILENEGYIKTRIFSVLDKNNKTALIRRIFIANAKC